MCGIVGYIGDEQAQQILLEGLRRLEYRGYDSAGVALMRDGKISVQKCQGRIEKLAALAEKMPLEGMLGIGHTRWATHGEPSDQNAHPHTDVMGDLALVHNGIIENHQALRSYLQSRGCRFVSQTDTEVAVHLLHILNRGDLMQALREAMDRMEGSYALAVISRQEPDRLYCLRRGSPLVIGVGKGAMYVASDIPALLPYTRDILLMEDKEIAVLKRESAEIYSNLGEKRQAIPQRIEWDAAAAEKGGYPHFMLKEIFEQPEAVARTLSHYGALEKMQPLLPGTPRRVDFVACGTAYHAGCLGAHFFARLAHLESSAHIASEYRYAPLFSHPDTAAVAISQSGETADTLAACKAARALGASLTALTNTVGSTLERMADQSLLTYAGPEIAVASTKAYTTQVETLLLMALEQGIRNGTVSKERCRELWDEMCSLPDKMRSVLEDHSEIQHYCDCHLHERLMFFIGRGVDHALAMEGALKLKEISYLPCEAYPAGELKHGAIALVAEGTPVFAICTQEELLEKTLSNLRETKARGAETVCICPKRFQERAAREADRVWVVPDADPMLLPLLAILPLQLLAYHMAVAQGRDVDKPRNLAKSVTVE